MAALAVSAVPDAKLCTAVARLVRACRPGELSALRIRHRLEERWGGCDLIPRIDFIRECIRATLATLPPPSQAALPMQTTKRRRDDELAINEMPLSTASNKKQYSSCGQCGLQVTSEKMYRHLRKHDRPFICDFCDYRSSQGSNLKRHVKRHHS